MRTKILYYSILNYQKKSLDYLNGNCDLHVLTDPDSDEPQILKDIVGVFAPLGFYLGKEKIDASPKLKAIASNTTGDPHIDIEYAASKKINVFTLKNEKQFLENITPTAEHTWGLILSLIRRTPWAFDSVRKGIWNRRLFPGKSMLTGLSLGIIGMGRLGKMVANYAKCFHMKNIFYYDPYASSQSVPGCERVNNLIDLVSKCDIISVHAVLDGDTEGMISRDVLNNFQSGSYIINTARAEIIDSDALVEALNNGHLAGAAIDVFEGEFQKDFSESYKLFKHPLLEYARTHENLLITPHIAGSTLDAWEKTEGFVISKMLDFLNK
jgi:D-3-phosphoglycerate dehydrogenase / 2-oxoglutarate reductase